MFFSRIRIGHSIYDARLEIKYFVMIAIYKLFNYYDYYLKK